MIALLLATGLISGAGGTVAPVVDETYYGQVSNFHHQDRFKKLERWFDTAPIKEIAKATVNQSEHNDAYEKAISDYLQALELLDHENGLAEKLKIQFHYLVSQEIERKEAEAAFLTLIINII